MLRRSIASFEDGQGVITCDNYSCSKFYRGMFKVERTHMVKWSLVVVIGLALESDFSQPLYFPESHNWSV